MTRRGVWFAELIAKVISNCEEQGLIDEKTRMLIAAEFATALTWEFERFDGERFMKACKPIERSMP